MDKLYELLQKIKNKPQIYLGSLSFERLNAFINGYQQAECDNGLAQSKCLDGFKEFIACKYNETSSLNWASIIEANTFGDAEAIDEFYIHFEEFISQKKYIIENLSYKSSYELQVKAIEAAKRLPNKRFLLQYAEDPEFGENCAEVFISLEPMEALEYIDDLFSWIEDLNTPGAVRIKMYLENCPAEVLFSGFCRSSGYAAKNRRTDYLRLLKEILNYNNKLLEKLRTDALEIYALFSF